ncbi:MAG: hypothetical protein F4W89_17015 [Acidobacteria bacterium]|nr:hypothetical protein [Acidobacteriota bacterium]
MTRPSRATSWLLAAGVAALYLLHQDYWFWDSARPLVFGFLPIGLFYHAVYSLAVAGLMWALVRYAWPGHLEVDAPAEAEAGTDGPPAGEPKP